MPYALDPSLVNETWEASQPFTLIDEGVYPASVFAVARDSNGKGNFYKLTFRINGTDFDGEDIKENYVGLQKDSIFKLHEIITALGIVGTYYDEANKRWLGTPTEEEMQGKSLFVQIEHEEFHSKKDGQFQFNEDGSPKMLNSARPTRYFKNDGSGIPAFHKTSRKAPKAPGATPQPGPVGAGAVTGGMPGATEVPSGYTAETPW